MFILILGGIASGKTTLRLLLRNLLRYRGRRVLSFSLPPFSYLTYILLKLIVHLVAVPPHLRYIYEHPIATLEKDRPALLGRMIKFITLFDMFQATSIVLLTSIISNIGVDILVEDSTLILDHFLYLRLYHKSSNITGSGDIYWMFLEAYLRNLSSATWIYLKASGSNRYARSLERGYRIVNLHVIHDRFHDEALERLSKIACHSVKIDTEGKTKFEVLLEAIRQVENN